jgi:hypothetical protein
LVGVKEISQLTSNRLCLTAIFFSPTCLFRITSDRMLHSIVALVGLFVTPSRPTASMTGSPLIHHPIQEAALPAFTNKAPRHGSIVLFCFMRYILSDFLAKAFTPLMCSVRLARRRMERLGQGCASRSLGTPVFASFLLPYSMNDVLLLLSPELDASRRAC